MTAVLAGLCWVLGLFFVLFLTSELNAQTIAIDEDQPAHTVMRSMVLVDINQSDLQIDNYQAAASLLQNRNAGVPPPVEKLAPTKVLGTFVQNTSPSTQRFVVDTAEAFRQPFEVHLLREGADPQTILREASPRLALADRSSAQRELVSEPFELKPGETVQIWIVHEGWWSAKESLSISTVEQQESGQQLREYLRTAYIAFGLTMVLGFLGFGLILSFRPSFFYALFFGALIVTDLAYHGYWFALLFPDRPELIERSLSSISFVNALAFVLFLRSYLVVDGRNPRFGTASLALIGCSTAALIASLLFPGWLAASFWGMLHPILILIILVSPVIAVRQRLTGAWLFALGVIIYIMRIALEAIATTAIADLSMKQASDMVTVLQVLDGLVFAGATALRALAVRRERDEVIARSAVRDAEHQRAQEELRRAKNDRDRAAELARAHQERLQEAGHDFRQPLQAMRRELETLKSRGSVSDDILERGMDHLDQMVARALTDDVGKNDISDTASIHAGELIKNCVVMFERDALERGIALRGVDSSTTVLCDAVSMIRILSNLIDNALKYSSSSRIILGVKRREEGFSIIVADNGIGMTDEALATAQERGKRQIHTDPASEASVDGHGFGLAIAARLASDQGFSFNASSAPDRGTFFEIAGIQGR